MAKEKYSKVYKHTYGDDEHLFRYNFEDACLEMIYKPSDEEISQNLLDKHELASYKSTGFAVIDSCGLSRESWLSDGREFYMDQMCEDMSYLIDSAVEEFKELSNPVSDKKYHPKTLRELRELCNDNSINLGDIDTSKITDMSGLFFMSDRKDYSGIETWDVSHVKYMSYMFAEAESFNQPLNDWDVSQVEDMSYMFRYAESFNQPLNNWNVSRVKNMSYMFSNAKAFNQPLNDWDVSNVEWMRGMFIHADSFNQPLNNWDVSRVELMDLMFCNTKAFNQPLNNWDVSSVCDTSFMFADTKSFNQPLNDWQTGNIEDMRGMFSNAESFNQPLNNWDVSKVRYMQNIFEDNKVFFQDIRNWDISESCQIDSFAKNSKLEETPAVLPKCVKNTLPQKALNEIRGNKER